jgi:hypothetical protein
MDITAKTYHHEGGNGASVNVAEFLRLNYFYGQMLSAQDFQTEQNFFREKMKLHNRCLHGYGVVCGLVVEPVPMAKDCPVGEDQEEEMLRKNLKDLLEKKAALATPPPDMAAPPGKTDSPPQAPPATAPTNPVVSDAKDGPAADLDAAIAAAQKQLDEFYKKHCKPEPRTLMRITSGLAIDCKGNEIILRHPVQVDPLERLSNDDYNRVKKGKSTLYLSVCYCEEPADPVRPVLPDACGATSECAFGKTRDSYRIEVTATAPARDHRCETCCEGCADCCLLLARIDCFIPGEPLLESRIHNGVRRPLGTYTPTTITGISWRHGGTYSQEEAKRILGTEYEEHDEYKGIEIRFSRPVRASTIRRGVLDVWVIEGGRTRTGDIYLMSGEFVDKPEEGFVDRIYYRDTTEETLEPGDRVLIVFRSDFVLDHCCRPVDGEHVGGRVPLLPEYERQHEEHDREEHDSEDHEHPEECCKPRGWPGPWTSGNRTPGGTFESWFYIREDEREHRKAR